MRECVDCGKAVEHVIQGSCAACFKDHTALLHLPEVLDVELCAHCDARHVGAHWVDPEADMPLEWIREDAVREAVGLHQEVMDPFLQFEEIAQDEKHFRYKVLLEGRVHDAPVDAETGVLVRMRKSVCDRCSRMFGNYYAAIIQLRATERDVTEAELKFAHEIIGADLDRQRATGNRFAFLNKSGAMHGGWDYYIGDIEAARQLGRMLKVRLGTTVQETAKLVGKREGDEVHRVTFLVRIKLFASGDFAECNGKLYRVHAANQGRVQVVDMHRHMRTRIQAAELKRIGGPEIVRDAIVVSHDANEVQIMDPDTFLTHGLPIPETFKVDGETVPIIKWEEELFLAPTTNNS
jgi:nonsense-mediated mRNA decay protein 3